MRSHWQFKKKNEQQLQGGTSEITFKASFLAAKHNYIFIVSNIFLDLSFLSLK